jgi:hypothetical protein
MPDPFSLAAGIVGILGLTIQISQIVVQFGLDWKDAPKDVKASMQEVLNLEILLQELNIRLISNPSFQEAFNGESSALLSHLQISKVSKDNIRETFATCQAELAEVVSKLKVKYAGHRFGWERFKGPFLSKSTAKAIYSLHKQCQILKDLVLLDVASLSASTNQELREIRNEHQAWHDEEETCRILRWLSHIDFQEKHRDVLARRHPGTGEWLLEMDTFKQWRNGQLDSPPNLWCPGIRE